MTFSVNEVTIGVSTNDILLHLAAEEVSRQPADAPSDRMARLVEHVIHQRVYVDRRTR